MLNYSSLLSVELFFTHHFATTSQIYGEHNECYDDDDDEYQYDDIDDDSDSDDEFFDDCLNCSGPLWGIDDDTVMDDEDYDDVQL